MHGVHGVGSSNLLAPTIRFKDLRRKLYETRYRILDIGLVSVPGFSVYAMYDLFIATCRWLRLAVRSGHCRSLIDYYFYAFLHLNVWNVQKAASAAVLAYARF